jgi:hypothetical protein
MGGRYLRLEELSAAPIACAVKTNLVSDSRLMVNN